MDWITREGATRRLLEAADFGHVAEARAALNEGADVNARNRQGSTSLHWAAWNGQVDLAKLLIEKGADVNAKDRDGQTALDFATKYGHSDIVQLLETAAKQQGHAGRVTEERKGKGPPQVGE